MVAVHEAGHWAAALLSRFSILEFRVGVFEWLSEKGWTIGWRGGNSLSGLVRARPTNYKIALGFRYVTYLLAGPFASTLIGVCGLVLFGHLPRSKGAGFLALWSLGSIAFGLINLVPMRRAGHKSDGAALFDALFRSGLRNLRFAVCCIELKDELKDALRRKDLVRAKEIAEAELRFAEGISDSAAIAKMLKTLHKIMALTDQDLLEVEPAPAPLTQLAEI